MEPENEWFPRGASFSRDFFSGSMLNFWGVSHIDLGMTLQWSILGASHLTGDKVEGIWPNRIQPPPKQMSHEKKPGWLGLYRGWNPTQLYRDYFINHEIRIPINQPGKGGSDSSSSLDGAEVRPLIPGTGCLYEAHEVGLSSNDGGEFRDAPFLGRFAIFGREKWGMPQNHFFFVKGVLVIKGFLGFGWSNFPIGDCRKTPFRKLPVERCQVARDFWKCIFWS